MMVTAAESAREPRHPRRLEKKKNTCSLLPVGAPATQHSECSVARRPELRAVLT